MDRFKIGCISFYSYIKPQRIRSKAYRGLVVYRSIPTSNRNFMGVNSVDDMLYIVLFLHQTATAFVELQQHLRCISFYSYIKPQHAPWCLSSPYCCISFYSYIKPQLSGPTLSSRHCCISFYSYIKPQLDARKLKRLYVVYRSIPTSNRNFFRNRHFLRIVVYRSIPTSNRNDGHGFPNLALVVYRSIPTSNRNFFCIHNQRGFVVYRSIPTSNRNPDQS